MTICSWKKYDINIDLCRNYCDGHKEDCSQGVHSQIPEEKGLAENYRELWRER